jgi:predicted membrane-bound spermidine synthase
MFDTAAQGVTTANISFATLGTAILQTSVLVGAVITATGVGGQGIQKPVRQTFMTLGVGALFLKGYVVLVTGAMGLF